MQRLVTVASIRSWSLHQETHDHVRTRGMHRVWQVLPNLLHGEVKLAGAQRLDAEPAKLDEGLLVLGGDLVGTLELSLSPDYVLSDEVLYQPVVHFCHLLGQLLVLAKYVAEELAQEGTRHKALVSLVAEQQLKKLFGQTLPVLEVVFHQALDPLPVETLDGDDLGELVEVDLALARVERPRGCQHLSPTEADPTQQFVHHHSIHLHL